MVINHNKIGMVTINDVYLLIDNDVLLNKYHLF